jgi:uncharacterized protein
MAHDMTDLDLLTRRSLLRTTALATGALALGPSFWKRAVASAATVTDGPYGPLGPPDALGLRLPKGFKARLVARGNEVVAGTSYRFPVQPDGQATFATPDGGWILVTNSEFAPPDGGVSAIRFDPAGTIVDAYRILSGTTLNCSGGPTPWGTWLSCEETDSGRVWECDPTQASQGVVRPALGTFKHEAVAVDSAGQRLYLTEDNGDGNFYRFTPKAYPTLDEGLLEVAIVAADGRVTWAAVPKPNPGSSDTPTRKQVPNATQFKRAEGIWFDSGVVYVATTSDNRIHAYDTAAQRIEVVYEKGKLPGSPISDPDNISVSPAGDLYIAENSTPEEEGEGLDVGLLTPDLTVSRFLSAVGPRHVYDNPVLGPSELTGPVFDPSGTRFYVTSQRARTVSAGSEPGTGEVYEISGPFRLQRPAGGAMNPRVPVLPGQAVGSGQGRNNGRATIGLEVPSRIRLATVRRTGIPIRLTLVEPATVEVVAAARFTSAADRRRRRRGARRRRRIGRTSRSLGRGPATMRLKADRASLPLLRGRRRSLRLALIITVVDRDGDRHRFERSVVATAPRKARA